MRLRPSLHESSQSYFPSGIKKEEIYKTTRAKEFRGREVGDFGNLKISGIAYMLFQVDAIWTVLPTCRTGVPGERPGCSRYPGFGAGHPPSTRVVQRPMTCSSPLRSRR